MINLKLFALLMCKGRHEIKAELLFDIILGPDKMLDEETHIAWRSGKLIRIFK